MEADEVALPLEHGRLEVVVEQRARHAAERIEGAHVAPDEALQGLVEGEVREHGARPAEHHHEARQRPLGLADDDGSEAPPVDLGLLTGQRAETEEGLALPRGPDRAHVSAQLHDRARVPPGGDHVVEPRREQLRVILERELDQALVGVQHRGQRPVLDVDEARRLDGERDRVVVDPQAPRRWSPPSSARRRTGAACESAALRRSSRDLPDQQPLQVTKRTHPRDPRPAALAPGDGHPVDAEQRVEIDLGRADFDRGSSRTKSARRPQRSQRARPSPATARSPPATSTTPAGAPGRGATSPSRSSRSRRASPALASTSRPGAMPIQIESMVLLLAGARDLQREAHFGRRGNHRRGANFFGTPVRYIFRAPFSEAPDPA